MCGDKLNEGEEDFSNLRLPRRRDSELFGIALELQGASHLKVVCADGKTRFARIPGKMKRRSWIIAGDLVIVKPWSFEDGKADIRFRYTRTQRNYLRRRKILPPGLESY